jgi:anaerobic magnesium-protoporphyrin IX monomethyl ester cyclase
MRIISQTSRGWRAQDESRAQSAESARGSSSLRSLLQSLVHKSPRLLGSGLWTVAMNICLIRTPRYVWPFNSGTSAFWPPLGMACLAAAARERLPRASVEIIDCPGEQIGWRTLAARLEALRPDVVGIGEETVSAPEGLRLARLVREVLPRTKIIAGGPFFGFMADDLLPSEPIDVIVKGEGEATFVELLATLMGGGDLGGIPGIACRADGRVVHTPPREPIADLDAQPLPAFDLLPMDRYGRGSRNHPGLAAIEHGRGCTHRCSFCTLWRHWGRADASGGVQPCYRTKSPERSFDEARLLVERYGRFTLGWVDPTWNLDPAWSDGFCGLALRHGLKAQHLAWMRADCVVRDEELGILEKQVRAGLVQAMIGVERIRPDELGRLDRARESAEIALRAFRVFRDRYPHVYTIGTMIYGLEDETEQSMRELIDFEHTSGMDYGFYIPLTPNPGTPLWDEVKGNGRLATHDFRAFNFHTPVLHTRSFRAEELEAVYRKILLRPSLARLGHALRVLTSPGARKRRVHRSLIRHGTRVAIRSLAGKLLGRGAASTLYSTKPDWYDS